MFCLLFTSLRGWPAQWLAGAFAVALLLAVPAVLTASGSEPMPPIHLENADREVAARVQTFATEGDGAGSFAVVPEPATYAAFAGLVALAFGLLRRRLRNYRSIH
jgi:hypothetical protein